MLTLKCKSYTTEELNMLYDVLNEGIVMVQSINCNDDCQNCIYKHVCIDLQSASLYTADTIEARQLPMRLLADGELFAVSG